MNSQKKTLLLLVAVTWLVVSQINALEEDNPNGGLYREHEIKTGLVRRVESSLKAIAKFMKSNYKLLNLDALTVLRITEATMHSLEPKHDIAKEIRQMISDTILVAEPEIKEYEPEYYLQLGKLADKDFWVLESVNRTDNSSLAFMSEVVTKLKQRKNASSNKDEVLDEDTSDHCIEELLKGSCMLNDACINLMTKSSTSGYTETHQVYYFVILEQMDCLTSDLRSAIDEVKMDLCAEIFVDILTETINSDIMKDLFMEQIGMCGLSGYYKVFSDAAWIEDILSWQTANGCYGDASSFMQELLSLDGNKRFRRSALHRSKREERIMEDNCLCHRTAVALLALSQSLRGLLES